MIEYEKKIMLTTEEYNYLYNYFSSYGETKTQVNYYYDTPEYTMNSLGVTCRIREKDDTYVSTIKSHNADLPECNIETTRKAQNIWDTAIFESLRLKFQGAITTIRTEVNQSNGINIALDRNIYLDKVDCELEVEYPNGKAEEAEKYLNNIAKFLKENNVISNCNEFISRASIPMSKSERFFMRKIDLSGIY